MCVSVGMRRAIVRMGNFAHNGRHETDLAVFDAALGNHRFREFPNCGGFAAQN